jgi:hypothetical protein
MRTIVVNLNNPEDQTMTILLGIEKHILRDFRYNNIQLTVGNDFDYYPEYIDVIIETITRNTVSSVYILGLSKTCTAGVVYAAELAKRLVNLPIHLFCFAPYTTLREQFYRERELLDRIPRSLSNMWKKLSFSEDFYNLRDFQCLQSFTNIRTTILFPKYGSHCEPECAEPLVGQKNITLIPLDLSTHAVLYLFWQKPSRNMKIEIFENEFKLLDVKEFWYFSQFQKRFETKESLYYLMFQHDRFIDALDTFQTDHKEGNIPFLFALEFSCREWLAKIAVLISLFKRKVKNRLAKI